MSELVQYTRKFRIPEKKLRFLIQQLTANGLRHARGPVHPSDHYINWGSELQTSQKRNHSNTGHSNLVDMSRIQMVHSSIEMAFEYGAIVFLDD